MPRTRDRSAGARLREPVGCALFAVRLAWRADRRCLLQLLIAQLTASLGLVAVLLLIRYALGGAVAPGGRAAPAAPSQWLIAVIAGLVVLGSGAGILRAVAGARQRVLAVKVDRFALGLVLRAAGRVELPEFEDPAFHDRLQRAVFASRAQPAMVVTALAAGLQAVLTVAAVTAVLAVLVWWLLPFVLLAVLPTLKTARDERGAGYDLHRTLSENRRSRQYLEQLLTGRDEAKEIRALDLAGTLRRRWADRYGQEITQVEAMHAVHVRRKIAARLAGDLTTGAVIGAMWWLVAAGRVELSTALAALAGLWQLSLRAQMIGALLNGLGEAVLYMKDLQDFAAAAGPDTGEPARPAQEFTSLRAESLAFAYPGSTTRALEDVSVEIRAGEIVALVGANGSGKTTLAKILAGLYRPDGGRLLYGEDGSGAGAHGDADPERLRAATSVVFQDFVRYKLTASDNITLGRPETPPDRDRAVLAAERAGAHAFLDRLPEGYDTVLGKEFTGGAELSLGQWQRLALARAFYRDAPLVILDEPTASLDPQAEADLFGRIRDLFADRTVLLISHRFANVREADRIYVLDAGRVVERGSHEVLMARNGTYARLFRLQAQAYQQA
ncbi:ABC transporter ATP-binding protein [Streptomyces bambusae]|uniref:ATP-binding cassette domain-containing protein n=1 Tax=Streptomyces bambusae TaxID=1550616 RepID=A0ABS6Z0M0_9ACTN|nr:ABC transporter ATP-binding protein [Streptomyces bambusae]MBW5481277.1 ATP-binding cassette domain-containing protein [Streptomyces bambusae]